MICAMIVARRRLALKSAASHAGMAAAVQNSGIDIERADESDPVGQRDQVGCSRSIWRRSQPMESRLSYLGINRQKIIEGLELFG